MEGEAAIEKTFKLYCDSDLARVMSTDGLLSSLSEDDTKDEICYEVEEIWLDQPIWSSFPQYMKKDVR